MLVEGRGTDVANLLRPAIIGRPNSDVLLQRWRYRQMTPTKWERVGRAPWKTASEMTRSWTRVVDAAGIPGIIPYALQHIRGIRANLPIRLVAALHDTSVTMIEHHYSRWITEGLEEMAAHAVVPLLAA